jgi:hypothetical protein
MVFLKIPVFCDVMHYSRLKCRVDMVATIAQSKLKRHNTFSFDRSIHVLHRLHYISRNMHFITKTTCDSFCNAE